MKKTLLIIIALLCASSLFAWEWTKEGDTVTVLPNEKSTILNVSEDAPWFNSEYEKLKIIISEGITEIYDFTFKGSKNIACVIIGSTVTRIGKEAFADCPNLEFVDLSESLISIDDMAFFDCPKLNNLIIPGDGTELGKKVIGSSTPSNELEEA